MSADKLTILKKAIASMRSDLDSQLTKREKEVLKDLIIKGQVQSEADLRGYLHRMTQARIREVQRQKEQQERRRELAEKEKQEEKKGDGEEGIEVVEKKKKDEKKKLIDEEALEATPAKFTGKVICAKTRRPLPYVRVRVQGTSFNEETESAGVFIWDGMPRARAINVELTCKGFKNLLVQYKSTLEDDQHIVVKMVPLEVKVKEKKKIDF